jgi:hypothetical protein
LKNVAFSPVVQEKNVLLIKKYIYVKVLIPFMIR